MKIRTLVVDDDGGTRERIAQIVRDTPGFELVAELSEWPEAMRVLEEDAPDLVVMDPAVAGNGVGFAAEVCADGGPALVLVGDRPELAAAALDAGVADYVVRPAEETRLRRAIARAGDLILARLSRNGSARLSAALERISRPAYRSRFVARAEGKLYVVRAQDINWATTTQSNLVELHCNGGVYTFRSTLTALEEALDPQSFLRVHRSYIVNIDRVVRVETWGARELLLYLACGGKVLTGRTYAERIYRVFGM